MSFTFIAFGVAAVLALLWRLGPMPRLLPAVVLWCLYGGYEHLMDRRILCTGECNIRVDLLLLLPLLLWVTARRLRGGPAP